MIFDRYSQAVWVTFKEININGPVSYSQLPLITVTIDSFLQHKPRLDVKYS